MACNWNRPKTTTAADSTDRQIFAGDLSTEPELEPKPAMDQLGGEGELLTATGRSKDQPIPQQVEEHHGACKELRKSSGRFPGELSACQQVW